MGNLITGISDNGQVRIYFADTTDVVEKIRATFDASPMSTMILGRLATGTVMMGAMSKIDDEEVTIQIKGEGAMKLAIAVADIHGHVKVSSEYTKLASFYNDRGGLDVARAVGKGKMFVIKDFGMGEPFIGQVELISGEIAEDFTHYFAQSEQISTAVGLGVLLDSKKAQVRAAGGFIVQLLPDATEETAQYLEQRIAEQNSVTADLSNEKSVEEIARGIMGDLGLRELETMELNYICSCSKQKVLDALFKLGAKELETILKEDGSAEAICDFCKTTYHVSGDELRTLISRHKMTN